MIKLLPLGIVIVIMLSVLFYLRFLSSNNTPSALIGNYQPVTDSPKQLAPNSSGSGLADPSSGDLNQRVRDLEETVTLLSQKVNSSKTTTDQSGSSVTSWAGVPEAKVKNLEDSVVNLQKQIDVLKASSGTTSSKLPVYIPIGSAATSTDSSFTSMDGFIVSLDASDYPGYSGVQLEITARVGQSGGKGYVRLFNNTDNAAISSSDTSTTSDKSVVLASGSFKLGSGRKTYQVQVKTDNGYPFLLQNARLKVNF